MSDLTQVAAVEKLVDIISPILAGCPAVIQGAVLADLTATWVAGHHVPGNKSATQATRAELLALHMTAIRALVPVNAEAMGLTE